jgi:hypothetical protein
VTTFWRGLCRSIRACGAVLSEYYQRVQSTKPVLVITALFLVLFLIAGRAGEIATLQNRYGYSTLDLVAADIVTVIGGGSSNRSYSTLIGTYAATGDTIELCRAGVYPVGASWSGLTQVRFTSLTSGDASVGSEFCQFVTFRVTKQSESSQFGTPLVLPTSLVGPYEISIETSTDLKTWSPAAPGVIPEGSPMGFWRLVAKQVGTQ